MKKKALIISFWVLEFKCSIPTCGPNTCSDHFSLHPNQVQIIQCKKTLSYVHPLIIKCPILEGILLLGGLNMTQRELEYDNDGIEVNVHLVNKIIIIAILIKYLSTSYNSASFDTSHQKSKVNHFLTMYTYL